MSQQPPAAGKEARGPGPVALGLALLALLAFGYYLWTTLVPERADVVIAYPGKSVLFAGHVGAVLEHTDILAQNGVSARILGSQNLREFGEFAERADVVLTGEAHGLRLAARPSGARIVATLGSGGRLGLVVPADSEVDSVADLKGLRVSATPANALHRWVVDELRGAGLADDDWQLAPFEGPEVVSSATTDAAAQWDPFLRQAERQGRVKVLAQSDYFTSVVFAEHLTGVDRELGLAVLTAIKQAFHHFNSDPKQVALWVSGPTGRPSPQLQRACFPINANFGRRSMTGLVLSPDLPSFVSSLEQDNAFLVEQGFLDRPLDLDTIIDGSLMDEVDASALPLVKVGLAPTE